MKIIREKEEKNQNILKGFTSRKLGKALNIKYNETLQHQKIKYQKVLAFKVSRIMNCEY